MTALIIEDEPIIAAELKEAISEAADDVEIAGTLPSIKAVRKWFAEYPQPDILFMDVQLSDGVSFEIFDHVKITCPVIFTTAYDEYAIKAFKKNGADYLLKPVETDELKTAIDKCRKIIQGDTKSQQDNLPSEKIDKLLSMLAAQKDQGKIALPTLEGLIMVKAGDIIYCESENAYTKFFFADKRCITVSKVLKDAEALLEEKDFFRVHNSYLINMQYVQRYIRGNGGEVIMSDGKNIPVSRTKRQDFLNRLEKL